MAFSFKNLGPGLLYAAAAIGVSHLVQSTRAGAEFSYSLIWAIVLANVIKYPFFQFGTRYAAVTGKSLIDAYKKQGNWVLFVLLLITLSTMFIVLAAILSVTAGLAQQLFASLLPNYIWAFIIGTGAFLLLINNKYSFLDKNVKFIILLLSLSSVAALLTTFWHLPNNFVPKFTEFDFQNKSHVIFLVALVGWMPAPIDISIWQSLWSVQKNKQNKGAISLKKSLIDFNIGYWGTTILAVIFLLLGAHTIYPSGAEIESSALGFSQQLISMYTQTIGSWAFYFIALAAFTTMFSTALTCMDAYPRVMFESLKTFNFRIFNAFNKYYFWLILAFVGSLLLLFFGNRNMRDLVDSATTISFVLAPFLAFFNLRAMQLLQVSDELKAKKYLILWAQIGLVFLSIFSLFYLFFI